MTAVDLVKTGPIKLLESRRAALLKWIDEGRNEIDTLRLTIMKKEADAVDMGNEIDEIEIALNVLNDANRSPANAERDDDPE